MQLSAAIVALVTAVLLGALLPGAAPFAVAQTLPHPLPGPGPGLGGEGGGAAPGEDGGAAAQGGEDQGALDEEPDADSDGAARQAHLDALFEKLADPGNGNWERTQAQIYAAWNHSGSPSMDFLSERADKAVAEQDFDAALSFLNDLTRLAPEFAEGWNKRATVYFLRDEYGHALGDIAHVLSLEPRHFGAYSGLGIILDRLGDEKGALKAYRRAVAIHPNLPGAADGIKKLTREVEGERL